MSTKAYDQFVRGLQKEMKYNVVVEDISDHVSFHSLGDIIKTLSGILERYENDYDKLWIETRTEWEHGCQEIRVRVYGSRPETDEEFKDRCREMYNLKLFKEKQEKAEYKRLQKKFEGKVK